ncbi:hypothetical protein [Rubrivirga marina]|uniref:Uncharacterized protein n=1 Tax=Rubrivirga marina TaxID=1196024 RepID=A0A271IYT2_9BACT|nr:hypothetical protein [Rubrivirga marina]PAP75855.1 hypothetical protein BSZ37_05065 [Rubrivirga marina]
MPHPLLAVLLLFAATTGTAQTVSDADWGIRFEPPAGWAPQPTAEGYLFVAPGQDAVLLVLPHDAPTLDALRTEAQRGLADGLGTQLTLAGPLEPFGTDGLAADFAGWIEGSPARARVVGRVAPSGGGATVLAAGGLEADETALADRAEAVARSIVFSAPPASAARSAGALPAGSEEEEWRQFLHGCRLFRSSSYDSGDGSGYIDEATIDLCPGYFTLSDQSTTVFGEMDPVSGDSPSVHRDARGAGAWSVGRRGGDSVLQLRFHDGRSRTLTLGYDDGKTFLDGQRWLRTCDASLSVGPRCQ